MSVVVVGLHERDASLDLLGELAVAEDEMSKVLTSLCDSPHLSEAVVLSTCNRTEVYAVVERFHDGLEEIQSFFQGRLGDSPAAAIDLAERLIVSYDDAAARHLFEVAAGIDSAILGEGEILRQVRRAAELARVDRAAGPVLNGLFRHALEVGKRARAETQIARGTTSLAHLAVEVASEHAGGSLKGRRLVQLGAGAVGEGVIEVLAQLDERPDVVVANRSALRAISLAEKVAGRAIPIEELPLELVRADVVVSATTAAAPVLTVDIVASALSQREGRPILLIDAAVPRDVEPGVADLDGVHVVDIDDLNELASTRTAARREQIPFVLEIVEEELERYRSAVLGRSVAPVIAALRGQAELLRTSELARLSGRLEGLDPAERALVDDVTRRVVAKLLHEPTVQLRQAAGSARGERLTEALRYLFGL